jgi:hypothetical protein
MSSYRYDDPHKPGKPGAPDRAKDIETQPSWMRFEPLKEAHKTVADEQHIKKAQQQAFGEIAKNFDPVSHPSTDEHARTPIPAQTFIDHENPKSFSPDQRPARSGQGAFHPAPGGSLFQSGSPQAPGAAAQRAAAQHAEQQQRAQTDPFGRPRQQGQPSPQAARPGSDPWSRPRGETGDRAQGQVSREAGREMTDRRQANPFTREMSDKAQRLVNVVASRDKDRGRGRD